MVCHLFLTTAPYCTTPQDVVAGDGTTSVTVLAGALLKASLDLLEQVSYLNRFMLSRR